MVKKVYDPGQSHMPKAISRHRELHGQEYCFWWHGKSLCFVYLLELGSIEKALIISDAVMSRIYTVFEKKNRHMTCM